MRNGGFPDWVANSVTRKTRRSLDQAYLNLVEPLFKEEAKQMAGLLWKDGGPVIGVQMDNECNNPAYLLELKKMARAAGIDVPLYTMTGWGVEVPKEGLLPVFGIYHRLLGQRQPGAIPQVLCVYQSATSAIWARSSRATRPRADQNLADFPLACAEIGTGMMSGYNRRIKHPPDIGAMALVKSVRATTCPATTCIMAAPIRTASSHG